MLALIAVTARWRSTRARAPAIALVCLFVTTGVVAVIAYFATELYTHESSSHPGEHLLLVAVILGPAVAVATVVPAKVRLPASIAPPIFVVLAVASALLLAGAIAKARRAPSPSAYQSGLVVAGTLESGETLRVLHFVVHGPMAVPAAPVRGSGRWTCQIDVEDATTGKTETDVFINANSSAVCIGPVMKPGMTERVPTATVLADPKNDLIRIRLAALPSEISVTAGPRFGGVRAEDMASLVSPPHAWIVSAAAGIAVALALVAASMRRRFIDVVASPDAAPEGGYREPAGDRGAGLSRVERRPASDAERAARIDAAFGYGILALALTSVPIVVAWLQGFLH
ncbi:MAG TPA: hypothetical protein VLT33_43745 [Labilithrix sp.]|nr:hypothetical protein [Labilithrix sp.]